MQIKAPDLGVDSADVSEVLVKVGDRIEKEQSLLVLESAKASVEVPSPASGVIKSIAIKAGQTVKQGDMLFELESDGDAGDSQQPSSQQANSQQTESDKHATAGAGSPDASPETPQPAAHQSDHSISDNSTSDSNILDSNTSDTSTNADSRDNNDTEAKTNQQSSGGTQQVTVPDMGVDEADVSEVLVNVGDHVDKGQSLIVLESAKASVEVPSPYAGVVKSVEVQPGQKLKQGMPILTLETGIDSASGNDSKVQQPDQPPGKMNESEASRKNPTGQNTATQDTATQNQKAAQQSESEQTETSSVKNKPVNDKQVDDKQADKTAKPDQSLSKAANTLSPEQIQANAAVYAGPAVRQLARQLGVLLSEVKASGNNQRIIKDDVFAFVKSRLGTATNTPPVSTVGTAGLPPLPDFEKFGSSTIQPMSRLQQVSVPQLSLNNYIPQVTQFDLADITELENWRNTLKADYKQHNISLTILAFIVKATAYLLKKEPVFNSHLADDQKSIVLRNEIHMGIAVATAEGLTVPVLRHPDQLSIKEIAVQLGELSQKARDKKLKPQELQGASFTITSLGSIGGTAFTPLVNWPQVAILGISPASMQAVWNGHEFQPRLMLPLSLSYDHRVVNGADAARFSHALTEILTDIRRVLL